MPRYPMTEEQAYVLTRIINKKKLAKRDTNPIDIVILTQVGALKIIEGKLGTLVLIYLSQILSQAKKFLQLFL